MKRLCILLTSVAFSLCMWAIQPTAVIPLYPDGAPDSNGYAPEDEYVKEGTKIYQPAWMSSDGTTIYSIP